AKDASHRRSDTAIARIPYPRRRASDWIAFFIQLLLAIAAIWYTVETRRLRLQSKDQMNLMENQSKLLKDQLHLYEDQTHLLRDQSRLSIAPYLSPGLVDIDLQELKKKTLEDKDLSTEERRERLNTIENSDVKFMCSVQNTSSKIPYNLNVYIYDVRTRSFLQNDYSQEYIKEND